MLLPTYNSTEDRNFNSKRKKISDPSSLASQTFAALEPFINVFDCGAFGLDSPYHLIAKEDWALYARHKAGEMGLCYPDGTRFNPYLHVVRNIFGPEHVRRHIEENQMTYYTSGRKGMGLLYLDIDAHHEWQTDDSRARELLQRLFPFAYFRPSRRGQNGYLKIRYSSISRFNEVADRLEATLKQFFLHAGVLCDIEIKGTITVKGKSGRLAKLPFLTKNPCNMRDESDSWGCRQLDVFSACPVVNLSRVEQIARHVEKVIDAEKVATSRQHREHVEQECQRERQRRKLIREARSLGTEGTDEEVWAKVKQAHERRIASAGDTERQSSMVEVAAQHANRGVGDASVRHHLTATPVAQATATASTIPSTAKRGQCEANAFDRNRNDLLPFVREYYRRHQQFPNTDDALAYLRDKGLFSGDWQENEQRRTKRVGQILAFIAQTFDPQAIGSGDTEPLSLSLGKYRWWVRANFGNGITVEVADLRRFDPVSLAAPLAKAHVPAKFIETFLVVADVCLNCNPLENKAVPTARIKKLWQMVRGGAPWNQRYFQIVRDRLDRMGVIHIFDRKHMAGKAWRWESGPAFPADNWKEEQRRLAKQLRRLKVGQSFAEFIAKSYLEKKNKLHNTLYQIRSHVPGISARRSEIRPPPD